MPCWLSGSLKLKINPDMDLDALIDALCDIEVRHFPSFNPGGVIKPRFHRQISDQVRKQVPQGYLNYAREDYVGEAMQLFTKKVVEKQAAAFGWQAEFTEADGELEFTVTRGF